MMGTEVPRMSFDPHVAQIRSARWDALNRVLHTVCAEDAPNGAPLPHGPLIASAQGRARTFEEHRALGVLGRLLEARALGVAFTKRELYRTLIDLRPEDLA